MEGEDHAVAVGGIIDSVGAPRGDQPGDSEWRAVVENGRDGDGVFHLTFHLLNRREKSH